MRWFSRFAAFIFQSYSCYLYESSLIKRSEADFLPRIRNSIFSLITSEQQLDELESAGLELSHIDTEARSMLGRGTVAGLLFVGRELVSVEWVALNEQANRIINIYPLKIDFRQKETYASGVWTNPKFRRNGLHTYVYYKVYDFLRENGIRTVRSIVATDNLAAQKAHNRFAPQEKIYARAHYLRILGLHFWNEEPFNQQSAARWLDVGDLSEKARNAARFTSR
jgi:ribosomal protein S18 acetylase RimI-like enzyme